MRVADPVKFCVPMSSLLQLPHKLCLAWSPKNSTWIEIHQALVCGHPLQSMELYETFQVTGLIHLIVISGSHLLLLEQLLRLGWLKRYRAPTLLILFLYVWVTQFQAPCLRAFVSICLIDWSQRATLNWREDQVCFTSGTITAAILGLFQFSSFSTSLLLSWTASLTLIRRGSSENIVQKQMEIYVCLLPVLLSFTFPSPLTVLFNIVLGPMLGALIFPASLLLWPLPVLAPLIDGFWNLLFPLLTAFSQELKTPRFLNPELPLYLGWIWLALLHLMVHHQRKKRWR